MTDTGTQNNSNYRADGKEVGNWTRFINHSCNPNLRVLAIPCDENTGHPPTAWAAKIRGRASYTSAQKEHARLVVFSIRKVSEGEPLTMDYYANMKREHTARAFFKCSAYKKKFSCGVCPDEARQPRTGRATGRVKPCRGDIWVANPDPVYEAVLLVKDAALPSAAAGPARN